MAAVDSSSNQRERKKKGAGKDTAITYKVKNGDTLHKVARIHDVSIQELAAWNDLTTKDHLKRGQKLTIKRSSERSGAEAIASPTPRLSAIHPDTTGPGQVLGSDLVTRKISYRVRSGDSLTRISRRFNVSINQIRQWNPGVKKKVRPGQTLTVYVDVTTLSNNI